MIVLQLELLKPTPRHRRTCSTRYSGMSTLRKTQFRISNWRFSIRRTQVAENAVQEQRHMFMSEAFGETRHRDEANRQLKAKMKRTTFHMLSRRIRHCITVKQKRHASDFNWYEKENCEELLSSRQGLRQTLHCLRWRRMKLNDLTLQHQTAIQQRDGGDTSCAFPGTSQSLRAHQRTG